ncbi:ATP-dependent DNA helicase [Amylocystis lapponica]|nr:ATP-dependent DNA helicase [Amylocystis lapponica]
MEKAFQVLKETFGFDSFRLQQEAVVERLIIKNENALVLFPTGGGKSLTYQVPALCLDGLTLVISPLIALMKDQVDALVRRGVKAANLDSTLSADRSAWVKKEVTSGSMKLLYVAPERLNNESFINMMRGVKISLLAVDESHCISQWGASFRPEYLKIARFAEELDVERVLCLTATATKDVAEDICKTFYIHPQEGVFRTTVYRPNLSFRVEVARNMDDKIARLVPILKARTGPAIVYVTLQKHADEVSNALRPTTEQREKVQLEFMASDQGIVCATIAFGMGIDKADIRQVIHLYMPKTLENYSQEVGRAGRDNQESTCYMFLASADIPILEGFARGDTCAQRDLELWLQEVAMREPDRDGTLNFNLYEQSKTYDIRSNVLNLCYAQLELDYQYIRAITPFYSIYDITARTDAGLKKIVADKSPVAQAIRRYWTRRGASYSVDMVLTAQQSNLDRVDLARHISGWELDGLINLKPSQIRARYYIMPEKQLPKETKEIKALASKLFARMLAREEEAVQKLRQVITFATNDDCLAHALATYFGDDDAVLTEFPDPTAIQSILQACPERDDARLLARMAFGITSPRLTTGRWSTSHYLFGSMVSTDFNALVAAFDKECKKAGYKKSDFAAPTPTAQKRSFSQTSSYSSRGNYGAGTSRGGGYRGGYKRGRKF